MTLRSDGPKGGCQGQGHKKGDPKIAFFIAAMQVVPGCCDQLVYSNSLTTFCTPETLCTRLVAWVASVCETSPSM